MSRLPKIAAVVASLFAATILGTAMTAHSSAANPVSLFKVVTVKDDVVIGMTESEIAGMASPGEESVTTVARAIAADGPFTVWQFAVRKGADGELEQAPLQRISLLDHESLRVEPYATPLRVVDQK